MPSPSSSNLSAAAQRLVAADAPLRVKELAARGIAPGLRPAEVIFVLLLLRQSEAENVRKTAESTLQNLPEPILNGALGAEPDPFVIDWIAHQYEDRFEILEKLLAMPQIDSDTVEYLASTGTEQLSELIATNETRLLAHPRIIERLYMNKRTRMSTADRLVDLAARNQIELTGIPAFREAALALKNELIFESTSEPTPDDLLFRETQQVAETLSTASLEDTFVETDEGTEQLKDHFLPLYKRIHMMTVSQKIRRAMLGTKEERSLLVRDRNRIVASAVVRSPLLQEDEVVMMSRNKNLSEEVLRIIASSPEWLKSYTIKKNLVENPKTPLMTATRLVQHLRESDLKNLAKSKNVTGPIKDAARRHLERRST